MGQGISGANFESVLLGHGGGQIIVGSGSIVIVGIGFGVNVGVGLFVGEGGMLVGVICLGPQPSGKSEHGIKAGEFSTATSATFPTGFSDSELYAETFSFSSDWLGFGVISVSSGDRLSEKNSKGSVISLIAGIELTSKPGRENVLSPLIETSD